MTDEMHLGGARPYSAWDAYADWHWKQFARSKGVNVSEPTGSKREHRNEGKVEMTNDELLNLLCGDSKIELARRIFAGY